MTTLQQQFDNMEDFITDSYGTETKDKRIERMRTAVARIVANLIVEIEDEENRIELMVASALKKTALALEIKDRAEPFFERMEAKA